MELGQATQGEPIVSRCLKCATAITENDYKGTGFVGATLKDFYKCSGCADTYARVSA
jgi:hypothetical protein